MAEMRQFSSRKDLVPAVVRFITDRLQASIDRDGKAAMVLSGGSTPKLVYPKLAQQRLDWEKVVVTLSDERIVPRTHEASNEGMLRRTLLSDDGPAYDARFVSLLCDAKNPHDAECDIHERLERSVHWPTTVTVLGMGNDGHTASLFTQDASLDSALDKEGDQLAKAVLLPKPPKEAPYHRMTLTVPALLNTEQIILLLMGDAKQDTLSDALGFKDEKEMPVRAILHQSRVPVDIFWSP